MRASRKNFTNTWRDQDRTMTKAISARRARPICKWPKVPPINLTDFARHARKAQIRFGRAPRSMHRDDVTEMIGASAVAAFTHHRIEAASGQRWIALQRLENNTARMGRLWRRVPCVVPAARLHCAALVAPFHDEPQVRARSCRHATFNVIIAQNRCFEFRRYTHKCQKMPICASLLTRARPWRP